MAALAASTTLLPAASHAPPPTISALAPVEIVLDGRAELVGVAVTPEGTAYVSDRGAGFVSRLAPGQAASGLDRPAGLALDAEDIWAARLRRPGARLSLRPARHAVLPDTAAASGHGPAAQARAERKPFGVQFGDHHTVKLR